VDEQRLYNQRVGETRKEIITVDYLQKIVIDIERHDVAGIRDCFANGIDPNMVYNGEPLLFELTSEYTRSKKLKQCVQAFVDFGLKNIDPLLLSTLLDDGNSLARLIKQSPKSIYKVFTLRCAYTPMNEATLLHICAEFNQIACAQVLLSLGMDVNVKAGLDKHGFGGQTPIFHTVNQNNNQSQDVMDLLLEHSQDLTQTVEGLIWGMGYPWETFIPSVNPISYAMMGLLPQMHRDERIIAATVKRLMKHAYGIEYEPGNIPNAYLKK
jgi:hypothetical protein